MQISALHDKTVTKFDEMNGKLTDVEVKQRYNNMEVKSLRSGWFVREVIGAAVLICVIGFLYWFAKTVKGKMN